MKSHGHSRNGVLTPTYRSWANMKTRCLNQNSKDWENYGGRGITICERWLSFNNFLSDMGEKPEATMLEREDNELGYEPNNCLWATRIEQNRNKRNSLGFAHALEIKKLLMLGFTHRSLGELFDVSRSTITLIANGKVWI